MPLEKSPARPRVVLVAEDEPMVRRLVKTLLVNDGLEVIEAGDGAEALELATTYSGVIDILLTDFKMPHMNGLELIQRVRTDRPEIGVLVMSAYCSGESENIARSYNFLRKPFAAKDLTRIVQEVLEGRRTVRDSTAHSQ